MAARTLSRVSGDLDSGWRFGTCYSLVCGDANTEIVVGHVFVSHASADAVWSLQLVSVLEDRGVNCWIAPRDIEPGRIYQEAIWAAIGRASALVLIHSRETGKSVHVLRELEVASRFNIRIVPVQIDDTEPANACGYMIAGIQRLSFVHPDGARWNELVLALTSAREPGFGSNAAGLLATALWHAGLSREEADRRASSLRTAIESCARDATGALAGLHIFGRLPLVDAPEREEAVRSAFSEFLSEISKPWGQGHELIWPKPGDDFDGSRMVALHAPRIGSWGDYPANVERRVEACLRPGLIVVGGADLPFGRIQAIVRPHKETS